MGRAGDGECRGDLVARAQRGPLSTAEQSALRAHLASCDSCRLIQQIASDYAGIRAVERGDELRLEQMSALARRAAGGGARPARRRRATTPLRAAAVAAGVVLLAGTASAAVWLLPRLAWKSEQATSDEKTITSAPRAATPARPTRAQRPETPEPAPSGVDAPALEPPTTTMQSTVVAALPVMGAGAPARRFAHPHTRVQAQTRIQAAAQALADDGKDPASSLLRAARAAATDGHAEEAVALYRRLQKDFPASSEALVGAVPLGRLLLERAATRAALVQFTRYLDAAPRGALVPEALYGRAQALARLGDRHGDRSDELATWQRLVTEFPDSPYGALARRRLSEPK